jgi:hypothetical protein
MAPVAAGWDELALKRWLALMLSKPSTPDKDNFG